MKLKTLALAITATVASFSAAAETAYQLPISNTAKISYTIDSKVIEDTDTTSFVVDRKVTFDLSGPSNDLTVNAGETITSTFTLTNTSNAPIGYKFNPPPAATSTLSVKYYVDNDNDGTVSTGDTEIDANTIIELQQDTGASDNSKQVIVEVTAEGNATDASSIDYSLVANAVEPATGSIGAAGTPITPTAASTAWDSTQVQTVVDNDPSNGADPKDTGIIRTEEGTFTVGAAKIELAKSVLVIEDPITGVLNTTPGSENFPKAIPGATVEYTLTITNSGSVDASGITLTDTVESPFNLSDSYTELFYDENNNSVVPTSVVGNALTFSNINVVKATDTTDPTTFGKTIIKFTVKHKVRILNRMGLPTGR
jgi:uncharacterized repeat protein (TIGR01451 family)